MNKLIGQKQNIEYIDKCIEEGTLPKFIIINGDIGSGRKKLAKYISDKLNYSFVEYGTRIEDVRDLIDLCYNYNNKVVYCISNIQNMSVNAKNSLLKISEEPPKSAVIIVTSTGENTLNTIKSRGISINMLPYTNSELLHFIELQEVENCDTDKILQCGINPGQCKELISLNVNDIISLSDSILKNITKASVGNTLKLASMISFKEGQEGVNVQYLLNNLQFKILENSKHYSKKELSVWFTIYNKITETKLNLTKNLNKSYIIDDLLITFKEATNELI